ncbi:MAG: SgcJ/EcaC family oxidoreductase [Planctomycetales bacterium]
MSQYRIHLLFSSVLVCCSFAYAVDPEQVKLQQAVADAAERYTKAYDARDAKAIAAMFTPEAEYVDSSGVVFHGRKAIEGELTAMFAATPPASVKIELVSIRPIAAGVMTEEGISTRIPKDKVKGAISRSRYTVTHVKQPDGTWLMASVRELADPDMTPHERLKDLAWLEGRWREESQDSVVSTEWKWTEDGNYLIGHFEVKTDSASMKGSHRIGWDPERKQFRSWVFDSTGGFAEGLWTLEQDLSWSVHLSGLDANASHLSGKVNYLREGTDAMIISYAGRYKDGLRLPDVSRRVVRQPPPVKK